MGLCDELRSGPHSTLLTLDPRPGVNILNDEKSDEDRVIENSITVPFQKSSSQLD
jgi:hypothetical protein